MIIKQRKIRLGQFQNIKFIFGSTANENKTKERKDKFYSMYYLFLNSMTGLKKSLQLAPVKLPSQTYFCSNITHF